MTRKILRLAALTLLVLFGRSAGAADVYQLDQSHSEVGFTVSHMLISKVRGSFQDYSLELTIDPADLAKSSVKAVIQVASINTANKDRDDHLRNADFFDATKYPTITFTSKKIEKREGKWVASGDFTMHGVTKTIDLPFTLNGPIKDPWGNTRVGIEATISLNRQDYGLSWSKTMDGGGLVVGDEVQVQISMEATKK